MAACIPVEISVSTLSHKQRRAVLRKERRKRKRQALAQARDSDLKKERTEEDEEAKDEDNEEDAAEEERLRLHNEWLERERLAQEDFKQKFEKEEAARKRKEEEERLIKEEWESQQRREQEEKEHKLQEKRDREPSSSLTSINSEKKLHICSSHNKDEAVQKMLDEAENQLVDKGPWMNPEAPVTVNSENFGTERDVANCPFFLKTGSCRFGDRCSRKHLYPTSSPTLMIRGMFRTFGMEELRRDDYDMDACLEHSEEELHESFLEFYHDVLPEFKSVGKVMQFKVCCNYEPHLRGNVYVQFETEDCCKEAFIKFNGRWYAGRQLHCEFCPVTQWKNAICGLFNRQKCPKGKHCNFLHVFRNPGNEFWEADRDLRISPDRSVRGSWRDGWQSERRERSWRQRLYSRSPDRRSERSHSRREDERRRSRSRERRTPHQQREDERSTRSRQRSHRYRGRERLRSRSSDEEQPSRLDDKYSRKEEEDMQPKRKSRSTSREKKRYKQNIERSPKSSEETEKTHRRHKHSKKSKKSKKKRKKSCAHDVATSSEESGKEKVSEVTADEPSSQCTGGDTNNTEITEKSVSETQKGDSEILQLQENHKNGFSL